MSGDEMIDAILFAQREARRASARGTALHPAETFLAFLAGYFDHYYGADAGVGEQLSSFLKSEPAGASQ